TRRPRAAAPLFRGELATLSDGPAGPAKATMEYRKPVRALSTSRATHGLRRVHRAAAGRGLPRVPRADEARVLRHLHGRLRARAESVQPLCAAVTRDPLPPRRARPRGACGGAVRVHRTARGARSSAQV